MAIHHAHSYLSAGNSIEIEKAWHLLSVLLRLGRPARPVELAERCELFHASADLVEFLCLIPGSPLFLTGDLLVTVSLAVLPAFNQFLSRAFNSFVPRIMVRFWGKRRLWGDSVLTYFRKRKSTKTALVLLPAKKRRLLSNAGNDEGCSHPCLLAKRTQTASSKVYVDFCDDTSKGMGFLSVMMSVGQYTSGNLKQHRASPLFLLDSNTAASSCGSETAEHMRCEGQTEMKCNNMASLIVDMELPEPLYLTTSQQNVLTVHIDLNDQNATTEQDGEPDHATRMMQKVVLENETQKDANYCPMTRQTEIQNKICSAATTCLEADGFGLPGKATVPDKHDLYGARSGLLGGGHVGDTLCREGKDQLLASTSGGDPENFMLPDNSACMAEDQTLFNKAGCNGGVTTLFIDQSAPKVRISAGIDIPIVQPSTSSKLPRTSIDRQKTSNRDTLGLASRVFSDNNKVTSPHRQQEQHKRNDKFIVRKQKSKRSHIHNATAKENIADSMLKDPKKHLETKSLPDFESYIIEEEEGSGGYGTVYRARRKNDGKIVAVKRPHANAHTHHVNNELKMLQRFGGRNFVIKYEGSLKNGNSECFVLEHVEHDRPEVLKREIDVSELRWYGYCMFRALASLHKHGIVHRDVKPGNFLFSRKLKKGYLIDFNLATDLNQKYFTSGKSKTNCSGSLYHIPRPSIKGMPGSNEAAKAMHGRFVEAVSRATKDLMSTHGSKSNKKNYMKAFPDVGNRNTYRSQGADGSGVTSTKDATSTRTTSVERLREPVPCQGRKELISLVQEALQGPNHEAVSSPVSQWKRVAAPPEKVDRKLVYLSPMPLHSNGVSVAGSGLFKNKEGKRQREGPCVGTKGFRAPEVLFKSRHQSPKVDIWSAGVTLLYLVIGRTPFTGDPEQNIKDIARLRGSEDLWELAKLHNRETSFPPGLFDIRSLPSIELREWCELNTKRPDFHETAQSALFDLIDKCLTVNPRLRISAEEALRHMFFAPCHEALRKQKLLRQALSSESGSQSLREC